MRTLWLQWGGNKELLNQFGLPKLDYPLCYNIPRTAWTESNSTLQLSNQDEYQLFIDMLLEVDKTISPSNNNLSIDDIIRSYRMCLGVAQPFSTDTVDSPTIRDEVVGIYYSRFSDQSNKISPPINSKKIDTIINRTEIRCNHNSLNIEIENFIGIQTITFLSQFTTLHPGDFISLGTLIFVNEFHKSSAKFEIKFEDWHQEFTITD